jgi:hypothetical protein
MDSNGPEIPVGDVLRSIVPPQSWFGRVLAMLKGIVIRVRGVNIALDEDGRPFDIGRK